MQNVDTIFIFNHNEFILLFSVRRPLLFRFGPFSDRMNTEAALHSAAKEEARYTRLPQMETLIAAVYSHTQVCLALEVSLKQVMFTSRYRAFVRFWGTVLNF